MSSLWGSSWGPRPLPELLAGQLGERGLGPSDAAECARRIAAGSASGETASHFVDLGGCKYLEGDIDGAVAAWRHAVSSGVDPAASRALLNLGLMYEHLHLHARAVGLLGSVEQRGVEPHAAFGSMAKARCEQAIGNPNAAMETMARLAQSTMAHRPQAKTLPETLLGLGELAIEAGRPDRAERAWRAASHGSDSSARTAAVDQLVQLLRRQGHDDEVVALLEGPAGDRVGRHASAVLNRAATLVHLGRDEQAMTLARSIAGSDLTPPDRFRLAELRIELGLVNEAIDELEVLLNSSSNEVEQRAAFALGEVYRTYDMAEAAVSMYERARAGVDPYWTRKAASLLRAPDDLADDVEVDVVAAPIAAPEPHLGSSSEAIAAVEPDAAPIAAPEPPVESRSAVSGAAPEGQSDLPVVSGQESDASADSVPPPSEPIVVVLSALDGGGDDDLDANPYAALAPDDHEHDHRDVAPSTRNPYAELAPNFDAPENGPPEDVEPGDWHAMLDDRHEPVPDPEPPTRRSRAFSRYT